MTILLAALLLVASCVAADAGQYYNSAESGCNGTDPNVLMCEDFEHNASGGTPGTWFNIVGSAGPTYALNKGWGASLSGASGSCTDGSTQVGCQPTPPNAAVCGAGVTPFGNCVGTGGLHDGGTGSQNQAGHYFKVGACGSTGAEECNVDEIYVRWYFKFLTGYLFSGEKHMNPTAGAGGIFFANAHLCVGQGASRASSCGLSIENWNASTFNQVLKAPLTIQPGRWYFGEMHVKSTPGSANGVLELWTNDCGVDGTACGAAPILRHQITNLRFCYAEATLCPGISTGTANRIGQINMESWANNDAGQGSLGTGPYWDQVKVSRVGPIGFAGAVAPPAAFGLPGGAGLGSYNATGAVATLTTLAGPTLIGFVHRATLLLIILAVFVLWRRRNVHR